jgi:hypothetical protein
VTAVTVTIARPRRDLLSLHYRAIGAIDDVAWPAATGPGFADRLWEHSCFEAFAATADGAGYVELNMAPSTAWAAYAFDGYRAGMQRAEGIAFDHIAWWRGPEVAELRAWAVLPDLAAPAWHLGLSAVIEERGGGKSYWALAHAEGPPDFHNRDCFAGRLAAPVGT